MRGFGRRSSVAATASYASTGSTEAWNALREDEPVAEAREVFSSRAIRAR
jgi:hypothetical protein